MKENLDSLCQNICSLIIWRGAVCVIALSGYLRKVPHSGIILGIWIWVEIIIGLIQLKKVNELRRES